MTTFLSSLNIPGSALTAEMYRLNLISQNVAHSETTRRADGKPGPYKRKTPVYQEIDSKPNFADELGRQLAGMRGNNYNIPGYLRPNAERTVTANSAVYVRPEFGEYIRNRYPVKANENKGNYHGGVRIYKVIEDPTPGKLVYDPDHPDANEEGYVEMPNVELLNEFVNMMGASRSYEANVQVLNAMKAMATRALDIGR